MTAVSPKRTRSAARFSCAAPAGRAESGLSPQSRTEPAEKLEADTRRRFFLAPFHTTVRWMGPIINRVNRPAASARGSAQPAACYCVQQPVVRGSKAGPCPRPLRHCRYGRDAPSGCVPASRSGRSPRLRRGARHPCRDPALASSAYMRVTATQPQTKRDRLDRSVCRAEKRHPQARMTRMYGLIRTVPDASAATCASTGTKCLTCAPDQSISISNDMPVGECR